MILIIPAYAQQSRMVVSNPTLNIVGTTANCSISVMGDHTDDTISIVLKLWCKDSCVATWRKTGTGYAFISESKSVNSGQYTLTADVTINGIAQNTKPASDTCP